MKRLWPLGLLALTCGCAGLFGPPGGIEQSPPTPTKESGGTVPQVDYIKLAHDVDRIKASLPSLISKIEQMDNTLQKDIELIKRRLDAVESAAARLIRHLDQLSKGGEPTPPPVPPLPKKNGDLPPVVPKPPTVDVDALAAESIEKMKGDLQDEDLEDIAKSLSAYATKALPRLIEALEFDPGNYTLAKNFSKVVSRFPPMILHKPLEKALEKGRIRRVIADTIGKSGEKSLGAILLKHASTSDEDFKSHVAEALAHTKHIEGVSMLISQLRSTDETFRTIAIYTLKKVNGGYTFGFRPTLDPEVGTNKEAISLWEKWFTSKKDDLFKD
jgi:hypothetical protein